MAHHVSSYLVPHLSRQRTDLEARGTKYLAICHHFLLYICSEDMDFALHTEPTSQCTASAPIIQSSISCYPISEVPICGEYVKCLEIYASFLSVQTA
jgi:hypothetical protein